MLLGFIITVGARIFAVYVPKFIGDSTNVIERYINGEITEIEVPNGIVRFEIIDITT